MLSLFASLLTCGAQGKRLRFSMSVRRESLIFAYWKALCMYRWRRFRLVPTTFRRISCWWSFAIMALAVRWSSTFSETPALATQSTSTAASMLGLARSTNRCGAIDSVHSKRKFATMPLTDSMEKPPTAERTAGPIAVFSNSYARLPEHFFARLSPTPVAKAHLIKFNESLASELGVDTRGLELDELAAVFAGNVIPPGAEPIAMAYAGHQFGNFVPQLGDGRAILLGEVVD